jgi:nitrogen fixation/metabolism regulation signal transduction histidine kinase
MFSHERRMQLLALAAGLPAVVTCTVLLVLEDYPAHIEWTVGAFVYGAWLVFAASVAEKVASPLRTLANLLEAMREGDFSIRGRSAPGEDALSEVLQQVNAMAETLRTQRLGALEATTLLRKVIEEIDVALFAFDHENKLRLINRAGEALINLPDRDLLGTDAAELGLLEYLEGEPERTLQRSFSGGSGRWSVRRRGFREEGLPHHLLVIADLTRALRAEELLAWQRLVRVLGHELNNSLTPIKSIAESLVSIIRRTPRPDDWEEDALDGLTIIATRSEGLSRFLSSYANLAKLPQPRLGPVDVEAWIRRVAGLEHRVQIECHAGPPVLIQGDADQLDQVLINLVRNAADASAETHGGVSIGWTRNGSQIRVYIRDEGPGLANTANLFVPFFTTKPGGSGIGLVLSRQIVEAHGGNLTLKNRSDRQGCEASLSLPL